MKKFFFSAAALVVLFAACKKDKKTTSTKDMLVGKWTLSEYGEDTNSNEVVDNGEVSPFQFGTMTLTVNSNGSALGVSSFMGVSDTTQMQWSLQNNDQMLRMIDITDPTSPDTSYGKIKSLDNSKFTLLGVEDGSVSSWLIFQKQ